MLSWHLGLVVARVERRDERPETRAHTDAPDQVLTLASLL